MTGESLTLAALTRKVLASPRAGRRRLVCLAGAPASGKSTLAEQLATSLTAAGSATQVVPMDGFHLHNPILVSRGLLDRKGAPDTFDVSGFTHLVERLVTEPEIYYPTFDRQRDIAIAGSGFVGPTCDTVIIEGNYLLFDAPKWRDLGSCWDCSIRLDVPMPTLKERLVARWLAHGMAPEQAELRANQNDLPNARQVIDAALPAHITVGELIADP